MVFIGILFNIFLLIFFNKVIRLFSIFIVYYTVNHPERVWNWVQLILIKWMKNEKAEKKLFHHCWWSPTSCTCNRMLDGLHQTLFACYDLYLKSSEVGGFMWGNSSLAWISHKKSKFQNFVSPQNSIANRDCLPRESTLIWCIITYLAKWNIRWMNLGPPGERNNDATTEGKLFPHSS